MRYHSTFLTCSVLFVLLTTSAHAGWSKWIDTNNTKSVNTAIDSIDDTLGQYAVYKRIQCKLENKRIYLRIYSNVVYTGGIFGIQAGMKDRVDAYIAAQKKKRNGFHIRSRSNVDLGDDTFSCIIWHKPH